VDALMFIDTSAIVAILADEPDARLFAEAILHAPQRFTAPHVRLEACMVLATRLDRSPEDVQKDFDDLIKVAGIEIVPLTDTLARDAVSAFQRFGKGRGGKAQLNLADCLSYAAAKAGGSVILFKGRDFAATDLVSAA
jgi:ribonuclease VapC